MMKVTPFELTKLDMSNYYFIVHLFDRILIGKENEIQHMELMEAFRNDSILEAHFFNTEKEVFVTRLNNQLVVYQPLEHEVESEDVITSIYQLDRDVRDQHDVKYNALVVKQYVKYDPEDYLAYIDKTVLYELCKVGEGN